MLQKGDDGIIPMFPSCSQVVFVSLLSKWPTFNLLGITCLVEKRKFKLLFHGLLAE